MTTAENLIKKHNLDEQILDLKRDVVFKTILIKEEYREYLAFIISYFTKLDIKYILEKMEVKNENISGKNISKKTGYGDIIVKIENRVINIEMNKTVTENLIRKNKWYVDTLNSNSISKNKNKPDYFVIQINISTKARIPNTNELVYEIVKMERNLNVEDVYNNEIIYDLNLAYFNNISYNELKKEEKRFIIFIEQNIKELNKIYKNDEMMKKVVGKMGNEINLDELYELLAYDKEAFEEEQKREIREESLKEGREAGIKQGLKEGLEQGIEQGKKETQIATVKKMLEKQIDIYVISEITNLSISEIEELKN